MKSIQLGVLGDFIKMTNLLSLENTLKYKNFLIIKIKIQIY